MRPDPASPLPVLSAIRARLHEGHHRGLGQGQCNPTMLQAMHAVRIVFHWLKHVLLYFDISGGVSVIWQALFSQKQPISVEQLAVFG